MIQSENDKKKKISYLKKILFTMEKINILAKEDILNNSVFNNLSIGINLNEEFLGFYNYLNLLKEFKNLENLNLNSEQKLRFDEIGKAFTDIESIEGRNIPIDYLNLTQNEEYITCYLNKINDEFVKFHNKRGLLRIKDSVYIREDREFDIFIKNFKTINYSSLREAEEDFNKKKKEYEDIVLIINDYEIEEAIGFNRTEIFYSKSKENNLFISLVDIVKFCIYKMVISKNYSDYIEDDLVASLTNENYKDIVPSFISIKGKIKKGSLDIVKRDIIASCVSEMKDIIPILKNHENYNLVNVDTFLNQMNDSKNILIVLQNTLEYNYENKGYWFHNAKKKM